MKRVRLVIIPILLACLLLSCAQFGIGTPSDPTNMSPKQFASFAMGVYNRQYADYKTQIAMPNRTPEMNKVLVQRKAILVKVYPLISAYDLLVASGQTPTPGKAQEQAIMTLLNQLSVYVK